MGYPSQSTANSLAPATPRPVSKRRWAVAALFALVLCSNQAQVSFLIPQQAQIQQHYGLGELASSMSILVIPLLCILLSIPCGRLIDRIGFRRGTAWGGGLLALSLGFRFDGSFFSLMAGQLLIGLSQPMLLNGVAKMSIEWFDDTERGTAIGISTAGLFLGLALGLGLPPLLVDAYGITQALLFTGLVGLIPAVLLWLCTHRPGHDLIPSGVEGGLLPLLRAPAMAPVLVTTVIGCGLFNALALCLEPMLREHGFAIETLSAAGALMITGGVIGSLFVAQLAEILGGKFIVLAVCGVAVMLSICLLYQARTPSSVLLYALLLGGFQLPGYALLIAMSEEIAGKDHAAQANSLITLAGNIGAGAGIGSVVLIHAELGHWAYVAIFLIALALMQTLIVTLCRSMRRL